jgi:hypothetical protein
MHEKFKATCPNCERSRMATKAYIGRQVKCPCGDTFLIRDPGEHEGSVWLATG